MKIFLVLLGVVPKQSGVLEGLLGIVNGAGTGGRRERRRRSACELERRERARPETMRRSGDGNQDPGSILSGTPTRRERAGGRKESRRSTTNERWPLSLALLPPLSSPPRPDPYHFKLFLPPISKPAALSFQPATLVSLKGKLPRAQLELPSLRFDERAILHPAFLPSHWSPTRTRMNVNSPHDNQQTIIISSDDILRSSSSVLFEQRRRSSSQLQLGLFPPPSLSLRPSSPARPKPQ